jgi:DNA-binding transcriptional MerR regulator
VIVDLTDDQEIADRPAPGYSTREVCDLAGVTYRQLDYWTRAGMIRPSIRNAFGSGHYRRWDDDDVVLVQAVAEQLRRGIRSIDDAFEQAAASLAHRTVVLSIEAPEGERSDLQLVAEALLYTADVDGAGRISLSVEERMRLEDLALGMLGG